MTYAMADIHGNKTAYDEMLEKIRLTEHDELYVIGDVIDRGTDGVEILRDMMRHRNIKLIMENHERMCLDAMRTIKDLDAVRLWMKAGGATTARALNRLSVLERMRILHYIKKAPVEVRLTVDGRNFLLVHASPYGTEHDKLFQSPSPYLMKPVPDTTVIVGHTPVLFLHPSQSTYLAKTGPHMKIFSCDAFTCIDCGAGLPGNILKRCLACIRLDDMAEFYVPV